MSRSLAFLLVLFTAAAAISAQSVPTAIFTDPPTDKEHPAHMTVLHIPTHGVLINGLLYSPPGAGPYPTLVICHGLPGNEKIWISRKLRAERDGMRSRLTIAAPGAVRASIVSRKT